MKKIILIVQSIFVFSSCLKKAEKETYLIPNTFRGNIIIVFDPQNSNENFQKDKRVYPIDSTGIFVSNLEKTSGLINVDFYFTLPNGDKNKIEYILFPEDKNKLDTTKLYVFNNGGFTQEQKNKKVGVSFFSICKPNELISYKNDPFLKEIKSGHYPIEKLTKKDLSEERSQKQL